MAAEPALTLSLCVRLSLCALPQQLDYRTVEKLSINVTPPGVSVAFSSFIFLFMGFSTAQGDLRIELVVLEQHELIYLINSSTTVTLHCCYITAVETTVILLIIIIIIIIIIYLYLMKRVFFAVFVWCCYVQITHVKQHPLGCSAS